MKFNANKDCFWNITYILAHPEPKAKMSHKEQLKFEADLNFQSIVKKKHRQIILNSVWFILAPAVQAQSSPKDTGTPMPTPPIAPV